MHLGKVGSWSLLNSVRLRAWPTVAHRERPALLSGCTESGTSNGTGTLLTRRARRAANQSRTGSRSCPPWQRLFSDVCCLTIGFGCRLYRKEAFFRFYCLKRSYRKQRTTHWETWLNNSGKRPGEARIGRPDSLRNLSRQAMQIARNEGVWSIAIVQAGREQNSRAGS